MKTLKFTQGEHSSLLCLVERKRTALCDREHFFDRSLTVSDLELPGFNAFMFRHNIYEACSMCKPHALRWAMQNYPHEDYFLFLDPDTVAYSRFEELERILQSADVVVTPHHVDDEDSLRGIWDNMARTLMCGTFNSGFLALRRSTTSIAFLQWWCTKVDAMCYGDRSVGLYFDQKWLDMAMSFFDLTVLREPGYNVANWNISKRPVTISPESGCYLAAGKPLRFIHFSGIGDGSDMFYIGRYADKKSILYILRESYLQSLAALGEGSMRESSWSYDRFYSGELISDHARLLFRSGSQLASLFPDPFAASNAQIESELARISSGS